MKIVDRLTDRDRRVVLVIIITLCILAVGAFTSCTVINPPYKNLHGLMFEYGNNKPFSFWIRNPEILNTKM